MPFATEEEIRYAHDVLIPGTSSFNQEKLDVIKEENSKYVQACPGSGKTTALLAKLAILANRMPTKDGKGVCVLTHTNVAIDEIKAKLGQRAEVLFHYPNFFGTFQTFVHKFYTSLALHKYYHSSISVVDDDIVYNKLYNTFLNVGGGNMFFRYVYAQCVMAVSEVNLDEIALYGDLDTLKAANIVKEQGKNKKRYYFKISGYSERSLKYHSPIDDEHISLIIQKKQEISSAYERKAKDFIYNTKIDFVEGKVITPTNNIELTTSSAIAYKNLKENFYRQGLLTFYDAYQLAFKFIHEYGTSVKQQAHHRFSNVYIDEVQDVNETQRKLIDLIFDDHEIPVQRFGDFCQAIFDGKNIGNTTELEGSMKINKSLRFGEQIAKPLRTICIVDNNELDGNPNIPSLKPIMLVFEDPLTVLPYYADVIRKERIPEIDNKTIYEIAKEYKEKDSLHRINIKAIGYSSKGNLDKGHLGIDSYYSSFQKDEKQHKQDRASLIDYIAKKDKSTVRGYRDTILNGILKALDICDIHNGERRYTKSSLMEFLEIKEASDSFKQKVSKWILGIANATTAYELVIVKEEIKHYLLTTLFPWFNKIANEAANTFFDNNRTADAPHIVARPNIFVDDDLEIEVATVHSVKGETHIATLYMETFYHTGTESKLFSERFNGIMNNPLNSYAQDAIKVAYVGMSRPRYLLCYAVRKDHFVEYLDSHYVRDVWDIRNI